MTENAKQSAEINLQNKRFNSVEKLVHKFSTWNERKTHLVARYGVHYQQLQKEFLKLSSPNLNSDIVTRSISRIKLIVELYNEEMLRENAISLNKEPLGELIRRVQPMDLIFIDGEFVIEQKIEAEINNDGWIVAYIPLSDKYDVAVLLSEKDALLQIGDILVINSNKKEFKGLKVNKDYQIGAIEHVTQSIYNANQSSYIMFTKNSEFTVYDDEPGYFAVIGIRVLS